MAEARVLSPTRRARTLGRGDGGVISVPAVRVGVRHGRFRPVAEEVLRIFKALFWGRRWALDSDELRPQ